MIIIDTHILIWYLNDDTKLTTNTRNLVSKHIENRSILVSAITFWECELLKQKGRIELFDTVDNVRLDVLSNGFKEVAIDGKLACRIN